MIDMNALHDMARMMADQEATASGQMRLGDYIKALESADPTARVCFDFGGFTPGIWRSYRGFYSDLAVDWQDMTWRDDASEELVAWHVDQAKHLIGATMIGYKGGEFVTSERTPLWVAPWGERTGTIISGVRHLGYKVIIETRYRET